MKFKNILFRNQSQRLAQNNDKIDMSKNIMVKDVSMKNKPLNKIEIWRWGQNNLTPIKLSELSRQSTIHRRILNDKADYITGKGLTADHRNIWLKNFIENANAMGQSLRNVLNRVVFDKCLYGNAFMEIVTDEKGNFISIYHQDASKCRVAKDYRNIVIHHDWTRFKQEEAVVLPMYPSFEKQTDGSYRAMVHVKEYEPCFVNYGIPRYISALSAAEISFKTDKWNVSRLDNAFQVSGVMVLDGDVDSDDEAFRIAKEAERKFAGNPGQVMFVVKNGVDNDATKFIPMQTAFDGDWKYLHEQAAEDIIVAHSWYRTLSGLNYATGFSPDRIKYEYNVAMDMVIEPEQREIMETIRKIIQNITGINAESLNFINKPPFENKTKFMKIWEARKLQGLEYDMNDGEQQKFVEL